MITHIVKLTEPVGQTNAAAIRFLRLLEHAVDAVMANVLLTTEFTAIRPNAAAMRSL